ncbi:MAG: anthranilate synthase component I [Candidatus Altiarchaeota archaeon]
MQVSIKSRRIRSAELDPLYVYSQFKGKNTYILESVEGGEKVARYSIIGLNPKLRLRIKEGKADCKTDLKLKLGREKNPLNTLRKVSHSFSLKEGTKTRFTGGLVGYFSYDMVRYAYDIGDSAEDDLHHPDCEYVMAGNNIIFDHVKKEIHVTANVIGDDDSTLGKMDDAYETILNLPLGKKVYERPSSRKIDFQSNMTEHEYKESVKSAKEYIKAGDIFQVVLSQRLSAEYDEDPLRAYSFLKRINPSPYMYFLDFGDRKVAGSSPEMLARVEDGRVWTHPIAGTRPRGKTIREDQKLEREMLKDRKERAEHLMLVDLGRNDVGRVADFGTVNVKRFMKVEKYSHVQHIVSEVMGEMRDDRDEFDALISIFPAGTVSGAPKVRAMEIIEELEPTRRGIYAGSVGYFSYNRNMDTAIAIRTIVFDKKRAYAQSGGGIVADSKPQKEYMEARNKAKALLKAIRY